MKVRGIVTQNLFQGKINPSSSVISWKTMGKVQITTPHGTMSKVGPYAVDGDGFGVADISGRGSGRWSMPVCDLFFETQSLESNGYLASPHIALGIKFDDNVLTILQPGLHWRQWAHPGSTVKVGFSRNFAPVKINLCQAQGVNLEHGKCMPEQGIFVIVQGGLQAINIAKDVSNTV